MSKMNNRYKMGKNDPESSSEDEQDTRPCVTWEFNSQSDVNVKNLPRPQFTARPLKRDIFIKKLNKFTSPLERTTIRKLIESKEINFGYDENYNNNMESKQEEIKASPMKINNRKRMACIIQNLKDEFQDRSYISITESTSMDSKNEPIPKEIAKLFYETNNFYDQEQIDSPTKLFELKTSSPFIGKNRILGLKHTALGSVLAPPLLDPNTEKLSSNSPKKSNLEGHTINNSNNLLDTDLDSILGKIELPSLNELESTHNSSRNHPIRLNKSLSEPLIEKKYNLLDDDLFETDDMNELDNKLTEIEVIATQHLKTQTEFEPLNKNTIILCDKTDDSIIVDHNVSGKCNKMEVEKKRLAALQRLKSRSGPLNRKPNFYPTLNKTLKR